jgi:hypothetical protein
MTISIRPDIPLSELWLVWLDDHRAKKKANSPQTNPLQGVHRLLYSIFTAETSTILAALFS